VGRAVGIDFGERRIGIAVSDPGRTIAFPHEVIEYAGKMGEALQRVAARLVELEATVVVVGLPLHLDGSRSKTTDRTASFIGELRRRVGEGVRVEAYDERLSSTQAERMLRDAGVDSKAQRGKVDMVAAAIILQAWLDSQPRPAPEDDSPSPGGEA
jgi:putative Holliday junction resolvase